MNRLGFLALLGVLLNPLTLQASQIQESGAIIALQANVASDIAPAASFLPHQVAPGDLAAPQSFYSPTENLTELKIQIASPANKHLSGSTLNKPPIQVVAAGSGGGENTLFNFGRIQGLHCNIR
jgi:hypothetical protein